MSLIGNILWIIFCGGLITCLQYLVGGIILCLTIIGIPFGIQCLKLAGLALLPFGRDVVPAESASGCLALFMNILWLVVAGIWIALTHLGFALACAITIIGIPFAIQHFKLAYLGLLPFGKEIR
ncbi:MAG: YccF domain-containing protein [Proteobacteria bacterium]|nr:YccF domain-containing protein [Pseudomonadota bacterium]